MDVADEIFSRVGTKPTYILFLISKTFAWSKSSNSSTKIVLIEFKKDTWLYRLGYENETGSIPTYILKSTNLYK